MVSMTNGTHRIFKTLTVNLCNVLKRQKVDLFSLKTYKDHCYRHVHMSRVLLPSESRRRESGVICGSSGPQEWGRGI